MSPLDKSKGLAQQLMDVQEEILQLIDKTSDPKKRKELSKRRKELSKQCNRLIAVNLDTSTEEYLEAAAGVERASKATRRAIDDVNAVQDAINAIANVVDLACKLMA